MKPAPFDYLRPRDIKAALTTLSEADGASKIIAGGQSLGPMLNLRLIKPDLIIDISGLEELKRADLQDDELVLGACVTHADIEDERIPDVTRGAMRKVASAIAYRAVRNRGTIGGSLSHADPAADWVSALSALGAKLVLRSLEGTRKVALEDFIVGALECTLKPAEILERIHIPARPSSAHWGYVKSCRKTGEFAHAIGAVLIDPEAECARVVIGALDSAPIVLPNAVDLFGGKVTDDYKKCFDMNLANTMLEKAGMSDPVLRHIHCHVLRRAVQEATA